MVDYLLWPNIDIFHLDAIVRSTNERNKVEKTFCEKNRCVFLLYIFFHMIFFIIMAHLEFIEVLS